MKQCSTCYLATTDGDQSRVHPFDTAEIFENKLYVQTDKVESICRQMKENPKIEINDTTGGNRTRLTATTTEGDCVQAKQHVLGVYPSLEKIYSVDDDDTAVLYLKSATAAICSFTEEPKVIQF